MAKPEGKSVMYCSMEEAVWVEDGAEATNPYLDFTAATCCCECNLARSIWGLSHFLIAEKGFGLERVRDAVNVWIQAIDPSGFPGDSCFTGGCGRPFEEGGCGGMHRRRLIFR